MDIIQKILNHKSFKNKPPILFHLGASGSLHPAFLKLKNYSVIVGVDGDERDFNKEKTSKNIKISQNHSKRIPNAFQYHPKSMP